MRHDTNDPAFQRRVMKHCAVIVPIAFAAFVFVAMWIGPSDDIVLNAIRAVLQ